MKIQNTLLQLLETPGVNGYESIGGISQKLLAIAEALPGVSASMDIVGNIIAIKGSGKKTILLEAHLDEVGFLVSRVMDSRKLQLLPVGEISSRAVVGASIVVHRDTEEVARGILGPNFVLGCSSTKGAAPGNWCYFSRDVKIRGDTIYSPALDNRVGCAVLIEFLRDITVPKEFRLAVVLGTQHEQGSRTGIYRWIEKMTPSFIFIVDSAYAKPYRQNRWSIPVLGGGPALQLMGKDFVVNGAVARWITEVADRNRISRQWEIPDNENGGTNASRIPNDIPFAVINIPVAAQHTGSSITNIGDLLATKNLLSVLTGVTPAFLKRGAF